VVSREFARPVSNDHSRCSAAIRGRPAPPAICCEPVPVAIGLPPPDALIYHISTWSQAVTRGGWPELPGRDLKRRSIPRCYAFEKAPRHTRPKGSVATGARREVSGPLLPGGAERNPAATARSLPAPANHIFGRRQLRNLDSESAGDSIRLMNGCRYPKRSTRLRGFSLRLTKPGARWALRNVRSSRNHGRRAFVASVPLHLGK